MTGNRRHISVLQVFVDSMPGSLPKERTAAPFYMADQINSFHLDSLKYQVFFQGSLIGRQLGFRVLAVTI